MRRGSTEYGKLESLNVTRKVLSDIRMDSQVGNSSQGQFFWRLFNGFKNFEDADTAPLTPRRTFLPWFRSPTKEGTLWYILQLFNDCSFGGALRKGTGYDLDRYRPNAFGGS